eukprot:4883315-Amphidinium_carterae.1
MDLPTMQYAYKDWATGAKPNQHDQKTLKHLFCNLRRTKHYALHIKVQNGPQAKHTYEPTVTVIWQDVKQRGSQPQKLY